MDEVNFVFGRPKKNRQYICGKARASLHPGIALLSGLSKKRHNQGKIDKQRKRHWAQRKNAICAVYPLRNSKGLAVTGIMAESSACAKKWNCGILPVNVENSFFLENKSRDSLLDHSIPLHQ